jgi:hypothetical protein
MRSFRRLAVGLLSLSLVTLTGICVRPWLAEANGSVRGHAVASLQSQPYGVGISIHSKVDPNCCLQDTPALADPATEASMSQCVVRDNQRWTLADTADGSIG